MNISGHTIAKNTIYNLLGYGIPLILAVALIPQLIYGLGEEKFGILNLAWVVIGYFSFFDFGIGKTLTKIIAEKIGLDKISEIPSVFWTSLLLMLIISILVTIVLIIFIPYLTINFFKISIEYRAETLDTFYALALSIPIVTTTAGLRGVLEAYQKFGIINVFRIILGISTFLAPILCLIFTNNLFWIVITLLIIRIVIWFLYLLYCFKINQDLKGRFSFNPGLLRYILKLGGWITIANIVGPVFIYFDRFLIGALVSMTAVTYYATPYEVITKLLLIPGALVGVLFPVFSSSYVSSPEFSRMLFIRGVKFVFILLYPIVLIVITFSFEGMNLWLGLNFANNSALILQLLAIGVLFNSIAYIPFHFLQGIGRPDIPAKINLIELPFYLFAIWFAIKHFGITGAAFVWMVRIVIDVIILMFFSGKMIKNLFHAKNKIILSLFMSLILVIPFIFELFLLKIIFAVVMLFAFSFIVWKYFLIDEERNFAISKLKLIDIKFRN